MTCQAINHQSYFTQASFYLNRACNGAATIAKASVVATVASACFYKGASLIAAGSLKVVPTVVAGKATAAAALFSPVGGLALIPTGALVGVPLIYLGVAVIQLAYS